MKNKVFWIKKKHLLLGIAIGIILSLILYYYFYAKNNSISYFLRHFLDGQSEIILVGLSIVFLYQLISSCERLIITKDFFIYSTLFMRKQFPRNEYQIVGIGAKEETHYGYGDDSSSTYYWRQLNIIEKETLQIFEIRIKSSNSYYQKIVSYLKMLEHANSIQMQQEDDDEIYVFIPIGNHLPSNQWAENLTFLLIGSVLSFFVYLMTPIKSLDAKWQLLIVIGLFLLAGIRNISFKKRIAVRQIDIRKEHIRINDSCYKDEDIIRVSMSSSHDNNQENSLQFLDILFSDGGRKRRLFYSLNLDKSQFAKYQELEEKMIQKYGERYLLLYCKN